MKADLVLRRRILYSDTLIAELVVWKVPAPVRGSRHDYKYRLALIEDDVCVLRYDNEAGKGDHKHLGATETPYVFVDVETLAEDFVNDIAAWRQSR